MSLRRIQYLRECSSGATLIKEFVTVHIFFDQYHVPNMTISQEPDQLPVNCKELADFIQVDNSRSMSTYKNSMNLLYPVNVARNIAREMATTHYVFPSDIEFYPSPNLIPQFLAMISLSSRNGNGSAPKVFVLPVFELKASVTLLPRNKSELIKLLRDKSAFLFHEHVCPQCHRIPEETEWLRESINPASGLGVFHVAKKHKPYQIWEPFYIGTKSDPKFDERLSWDGKRDKLVQAYLLCLLDYEFHILDNAFLVHRPGIKRSRNGKRAANKKYELKNFAVYWQDNFIEKVVIPELKNDYGDRPECAE